MHSVQILFPQQPIIVQALSVFQQMGHLSAMILENEGVNAEELQPSDDVRDVLWLLSFCQFEINNMPKSPSRFKKEHFSSLHSKQRIQLISEVQKLGMERNQHQNEIGSQREQI